MHSNACALIPDGHKEYEDAFSEPEGVQAKEVAGWLPETQALLWDPPGLAILHPGKEGEQRSSWITGWGRKKRGFFILKCSAIIHICFAGWRCALSAL